jgi:6-phospho-3-hexuloisomerase
MEYDDVRFAAVEELRTLLSLIEPDEIQQFVGALGGAGSIYVAGVGRSGLVMRGFAMRLMHLGLSAYVVGEVTAPRLRPGDLLVVGSGSGATPTLLPICEKAKEARGSIALLTTNPRSPLGAMANVRVRIPASTPKAAAGTTGEVPSRQPMASLFEQGLWILLDTCIMLLMDQSGVSAETMFARHANLE